MAHPENRESGPAISVRSTLEPDDGKPFVDLEVLHSADGVKGVISLRRRNNQLTFMLTKEFSIDGEKKTTSFFPVHMLGSVEDMLQTLKTRMAVIAKERGLSVHGTPPARR